MRSSAPPGRLSGTLLSWVRRALFSESSWQKAGVRWGVSWLWLASVVFAGDDSRFLNIFSPFRTETAALSADGRKLAYSFREDDRLLVLVVSVDDPARATARVLIGTDGLSTPYGEIMAGGFDDTPAAIRALSWVGEDRVVALTNRFYREKALFTFDATGRHARVLSAPGGYPPRRFDIDPQKPAALLVDGGSETFFEVSLDTGKYRQLSKKVGIERVEIARGQQKALKQDSRQVSAELSEVLPGKALEIIENDRSGNRYLVKVQGLADPGAFHVIDRSLRKSWEMVRRAPALDDQNVHVSEAFECSTASGDKVTGVLTIPRRPRVKTVPVIVLHPSRFDISVPNEFSAAVLAYAEMGFAVLQLDGWAARAARREPLSEEMNVYRQVEYTVAALDHLSRTRSISRRYVAIAGAAGAGRSALLAFRDFPGLFRCAIGIESTLFPQPLPVSGAVVKESVSFLHSPIANSGLPEAGGPPAVLLFSYPGEPPQSVEAPRVFLPNYLANWDLKAVLKRSGCTVEFKELNRDYDRRKTAPSTAAVFRNIEPFLNLHLYAPTVNLGPSTPVPE